jgi:hypothetical protein
LRVWLKWQQAGGPEFNPQYYKERKKEANKQREASRFMDPVNRKINYSIQK